MRLVSSPERATFNTVRTSARLAYMKKKRPGGRKRKPEESIGALMARARWQKTTPAQRHEVAMKLVEARRKKREQEKPPE